MSPECQRNGWRAKSYLSSKEADVLPLDVLSESHLEEGEPHVKRLHDVGLPRQRVVPVQYKPWLRDTDGKAAARRHYSKRYE